MSETIHGKDSKGIDSKGNHLKSNDLKGFTLKKKKRFTVQCPFNENHIFDKVFTLEEGIDPEPTHSEVEAFCPWCDKMVTITVTGEAEKNETLFRALNEQDQRFKRK